jgi:cytochrome oxidase Cu insertion factor (SCO1/SenC/PrrC family)
MRNKLLLFALCLGLLALTACQEQKEADSSALTRPLPSSPSPTPDPSRTDVNRVVPGTVAPDFALAAMNGETYSLSSFRGKKFVVLVFYRGYF